jgi:hypothetical protein
MQTVVWPRFLQAIWNGGSFLTGNKVAAEQERKSCVLESRGE